MKALILSILLVWTCGSSPLEESQGDSQGIITHLADLVFGEDARIWAKPVREADMARIRELLDLDVLTRHTAEWAVPAGEDEGV
jgi:hypothetical protein